MNLRDHLHRSFEKAENEDSKITREILDLEGMTGVMTRHFYNNIVSGEGIRYLEIGTWKGSSVCSAMYGNNAQIVCIDNWCGFNDDGSVKAELISNVERFKGNNTIQVIEGDCFSMDVSKLGKFNVYLYDAGHTAEEQKKALTYFYDCLDDEFIYICDDWDWADPRKGTFDAIEELGLEIVDSVERSLNEGDSWKPILYAQSTWWNGIWAAVLRKTPNQDR